MFPVYARDPSAVAPTMWEPWPRVAIALLTFPSTTFTRTRFCDASEVTATTLSPGRKTIP
jgi:hypothetical protein